MSTLATTTGLLAAYTTRLAMRACGLLLSLAVLMPIFCIRGLRLCVLQTPVIRQTGTLSVASQDATKCLSLQRLVVFDRIN